MEKEVSFFVGHFRIAAVCASVFFYEGRAWGLQRVLFFFFPEG